MVCLGLEPGAAGWQAQMNLLSYGGTPSEVFLAEGFRLKVLNFYRDDKIFFCVPKWR